MEDFGWMEAFFRLIGWMIKYLMFITGREKLKNMEKPISQTPDGAGVYLLHRLGGGYRVCG